VNSIGASPELTRARRARESAEADAFDTFLQRTCPVIPLPELASLPRRNAGLPACPAEPRSDYSKIASTESVPLPNNSSGISCPAV
jgi:hypothetical protein